MIEIAGAIALVFVCLLPFAMLLGVAMLGGALKPRAKLKVEAFFLASYGVIAPAAAWFVAAEDIASGQWLRVVMLAVVALVGVYLAITEAGKRLSELKAFEGEKA